MFNTPWNQAMTYDEMPDQHQDAVDRRAEVYSNQAFGDGMLDGEEVALFNVGEDTIINDILNVVDYTEDTRAVAEGNITAAAIETVADDVLKATNADTAIIYDRTEQTTIYQEDVDLENPLDIVREIGEHYEDIESEERVEAHEDQLSSALSEADPDVRQKVVQSYQEAFESMQQYEQDEDVNHPETAAQRDMMQTIRNSNVETKRVNEAFKAVEVNTDPVFSRTMSSGYFRNRRAQQREKRQ